MASAQVSAEDWIAPGEEKFTVSAGIFLTSFDTRVQVDNADLDVGDDIDLEDDLDLKDSEVIFWGGGIWRFKPRHQLAVSYFNWSRDATATALEDITIGDETFPVGAEIQTDFKFQSIPVTYGYSFIKSRKNELAATVGLHWNSINLSFAADAFVGGEGTDGKVSAKADAPLPLIGLVYSHYLNDRWILSLHGEVFSIRLSEDVSSFSGSLANTRASAEYLVINNLSVGLAVNWFQLDVEVQSDDWQGELKYEYFGPQLYVTGRF
ncbi:MAG: hypothetical protein AMS22_00030 [Thiotrichales bacterium SG8_50]|nr:MAG: hypothetical protein AMS22_00030 [Thiotrichales bacterium SG8_50]